MVTSKHIQKAGIDLSKISRSHDFHFKELKGGKVSRILLSHQNRSDTKPWTSRCLTGLFP